MVKPGSKDRKTFILVTGLELDGLERFTGFMAESFGLDRRVANYQGVRPDWAMALGHRMPGRCDQFCIG